MFTYFKARFFKAVRAGALWAGVVWLVSTAAAGQGAPVMRCVEPRHDFGTLRDDQTVQHLFRVENRGDAPLELKVGRACCGAEIALPNGAIPPGHASGVQVQVTLRGWDGVMRKILYVRTNDPAQPILRLELVGRVTAITGAARSF